MMPSNLREFVARQPALVAAIASALSAVTTAVVLAAVYHASLGAIFASLLAGLVVAVLAGATFGTLLREHTDALYMAATRISDLAADCVPAEDRGSERTPSGGVDAARLDRDVTAIGRAYRSLEREREQAQSSGEQQIARQAEFYARLSHELRSPLNAILGYASLAIEDADAGELGDLPQDLRKIRGAGQNLLALIDNLLQLAEDRTGRETAARVPFVLREVLTQVAREHGQTSAVGDIAVDAGAGHETLFGNRAKVARAVASLLDDAIRSRRAEAITIATRPSDTRDACIEIVVHASSSAGSPVEESETLTRHLADRLAAAVSGSLTVEPQGPGSWIYVLCLPFDSEADADAVKTAGRALPLNQASAEARPELEKSALIIDDDPATIELMSRWLERGGYRVKTATNADHGLAIAQAMEPDVVLLDALMPGRTGYDILPDLNALPALRDTPILIVTVDDDRTRGLAAGASDYVRKPVTENRLREIISVYERDLSGEVLIIDDDPDAADLLDRTVRRLGFTTRHAADGAEGLAALDHNRPAAILLDLNMPNLNGFDFIERLAQSEHYASIPLIVLSGQELSMAQHHRLLAAGCRYYMKGDAAPREIAATLREMVA